MEVEEMINKIREQQGQSFDPRQLVTSCVANIIMNILFGHRFDHSDTAFQQHISDVNDGASSYSLAIEIFPPLRFLPYFKKRLAKCHRALRNGFTFISNNIATCLLVCTVVFHCMCFCKTCDMTIYLRQNGAASQQCYQCLK